MLPARGVRTESDLAFAGLQRLLQPLSGRVDDLSPRQAATLRHTLETGNVPGGGWFTLATGCRDLLTGTGHTTPLVCWVDDAHLLDPPSLEVLAFAARRLDTAPVALVFTASHSHTPSALADLTHLPLAPLNERNTHALLDEAAPVLAAPVRARLALAAHGNPRAASGFTALLTLRQLDGTEPLPEVLPLDADLRGALTAPVDALPETTRELVLLAACAPGTDTGTVLRAAHHPKASATALDPAEEAGIVRTTNGRLHFPNRLLPAAVYQHAPFSHRRAAHHRLARTLDPRRQPTRYARHNAAAADAPDAGTAAALTAAAHTARTLEGRAASSEAFAHAADLTPHSGERSCRLSSAAYDAWQAGDHDRATVLLTDARALASGGKAAGSADLVQAAIGMRVGNAFDAADALLAAARKLLPHDRVLAMRALVRAADAASLAGDPHRHAQAQQLVPRARDDDPPVVELGRAFLDGCTASFAGDYPASVGPLRRAVALADDIGEPDELVWGGIAALRLGDTPRVRELATRAVTVARQRGERASAVHAREILVHAEFWTGRFPSALGSGMAGLRAARVTGQPNCATHLLASLALLAAIQGDADTCQARARSVTAHASRHNLGLPAALSSWALAVLDLARGDAPGAFARLRVLARADPGYGHPTMRLLTAPLFVESAVRTGENQWARQVLRRYEQWAEAIGSPSALALAARCRGLLATPEEAAPCFEEALRLHRDSADDSVERARTALLYGTSLRRNREPGRARGHLREALETFDRIGARLWAEQARAELRAAGETGADGTPQAATELTPQQHQIALLVAQGVTNREAAAHLFLSPRTVEHHLRVIFRKLNIRSRVELARFLP